MTENTRVPGPEIVIEVDDFRQIVDTCKCQHKNCWTFIETLVPIGPGIADVTSTIVELISGLGIESQGLDVEPLLPAQFE